MKSHQQIQELVDEEEVFVVESLAAPTATDVCRSCLA